MRYYHLSCSPNRVMSPESYGITMWIVLLPLLRSTCSALKFVLVCDEVGACVNCGLTSDLSGIRSFVSVDVTEAQRFCGSCCASVIAGVVRKCVRVVIRPDNTKHKTSMVWTVL